MEHDDAGHQSAPEGPILCVNNCGFFGSAATMNMCSKCHKDLILKEEQAKLAQASISKIINGGSSSSVGPKELLVSSPVNKVPVENIEPKAIVSPPPPASGPSRCTTCSKRVGLTGFKCRCGNLFCGSHRYSEKHDCPFDYRAAGRDEIAKANPVIKAEKLDKI